MPQENKKEPAMIPFFVHENDMMHKEMDMEKLQQECKEAHKEAERAHKTTRILCWTFLAIVVVFVTGYTIRTTRWLETIDRLYSALVEVCRTYGITPP